MTQQIMELARALGNPTQQEEGLLFTLCEAAAKELSASLRDGVTPEQCAESFAVAGAWLALSGLEVSRGPGQAQSFSAGDLTVHGGDAQGKAAMLRRQAMTLMGGWVKDRNFLFYGVTSR